MGAINALDLAKRVGARIFQASTSEVYGDPEVHPQTEDYKGNVNPIGPRACYDEGKRCAETLFFDYHRQNKVDIRVIRIFNTYGPRMRPDDGRVVSNFIIQALKGEGITVYGDGKQTRSFCYVDDLVEGILRLMTTEKGVTGPMNLGNPIEYTILEIAEIIIDQIGSKSKIIFEPLPEDDPKQRQPDISFAKSELNWEANTQLKEGLKKTTLKHKGDLVLSNSATPGIPKFLAVDTCVHDGWMHFPSAKVSNEYLYLLFLSIRPKLLQQGSGSVFVNLKTDTLRQFETIIASKNDFDAFDNLIKPIFTKIYNNALQIQSLTKTRDTLLPKLMSGQVRVNNIKQLASA